MIGLSTERLAFRAWTNADFPEFAEFFSNVENTQFLGGIKSLEEAWRLMATYMGHYALHGFAYLALEEKDNGQLIGSVGLWNSTPWPEPELGYWLFPEARGKGYGVEAGLEVKNYALNVLRLNSLVSYIATKNEASKKLANRLGAKFDGTIDLLDFGPHEVYRYF